jgi:hypothetical protein
MPLKVDAGGGYAHVHCGMGGRRNLNSGIGSTREQTPGRKVNSVRIAGWGVMDIIITAGCVSGDKIAAGGVSGVRIAAGRVSSLEEVVTMLKMCNCRPRKAPPQLRRTPWSLKEYNYPHRHVRRGLDTGQNAKSV